MHAGTHTHAHTQTRAHTPAPVTAKLTLCLLANGDLQALVDGEIHSPVGKQCKEGGCKPAVQPWQALCVEDCSQAACKMQQVTDENISPI